MLIAVIAVVVVAVGAVVAKLTWRPNSDEVHSVRHYQAALGTIEHLAERNKGATVRVLDGPGTPVGAPLDVEGEQVSARRGSDIPGLVAADEGPGVHAPGAHAHSRSTSPVRSRVGGAPLGSGSSLSFDDAQPLEAAAPLRTHGSAPAFRSDRARRQALQSMNHRPRQWAAVLVTVAVVAGVGVLVFVGSRRATGHVAGQRSDRSVVTAPVRRAPTSHKPGSAKSAHPPSTTVPPQYVASASSSGGTTAQYTVPAGSYIVTVTATSLCWVDAVSLASGSTLWTGTLQPGASQVIDAPGAMSLELGAPGASIAVGGVPVVFPTPMHTPFTATFRSSGTGTGTATG